MTRPVYIGRPIRFDRQELDSEHLAKYGYFNPILNKKGEPAVIPAGTELVDINGNEFNSYEECYHAVIEDDECPFDFKGLDDEIRDILHDPSAPCIDFCAMAFEEYNPRYWAESPKALWSRRRRDEILEMLSEE